MLNELVYLGKDKCYFFSLRCGQNSGVGKAPEPVNFTQRVGALRPPTCERLEELGAGV